MRLDPRQVEFAAERFDHVIDCRIHFQDGDVAGSPVTIAENLLARCAAAREKLRLIGHIYIISKLIDPVNVFFLLDFVDRFWYDKYVPTERQFVFM